MKVVSAEEMRTIDRIAIQERGIPSLDLMERAGKAVADIIMSELEPESVAVVTGKGNNAGDGFVVARLLVEQKVRTKVFMLSPHEDLKGDALIKVEAAVIMVIISTCCHLSLRIKISEKAKTKANADVIYHLFAQIQYHPPLVTSVPGSPQFANTSMNTSVKK